MLAYDLDTKVEGKGVSVCPGPNIAYFSNQMSLKEITRAIYDTTKNITRADRPNMFMKELHIYMDYLQKKMEDAATVKTPKEVKYLKTFISNLNGGIDYYLQLFKTELYKIDNQTRIMMDLENYKLKLNSLNV